MSQTDSKQTALSSRREPFIPRKKVNLANRFTSERQRLNCPAGLALVFLLIDVRLEEDFATRQEKERQGEPAKADADKNPGVNRYEIFHIIFVANLCCDCEVV